MAKKSSARTGKRSKRPKVEGFVSPRVYREYDNQKYGSKSLMVESAVTAMLGAPKECQQDLFTYINVMNERGLEELINCEEAFEILNGRLDPFTAVQSHISRQRSSPSEARSEAGFEP